MIKNLSTRVAALEKVISPLKTKLVVWDPEKETLEEARARVGMGTEENELNVIVELL
jgi:hypothetical protein